MTHSMRKSLLGSVGAFIVTLGIAASGWSMSHSGNEGAEVESSAGNHMGDRVEHRVAHMAKKFDLSERQREAITQLMHDSYAKVGGDKARMRELKQSVMHQRKVFDPAAMQLAADEIGELTGRMVYQRASTHAQIYQVLNEDQQAKMDAMVEKRSKHREHRRGQRRGRMGGMHI